MYPISIITHYESPESMRNLISCFTKVLIYKVKNTQLNFLSHQANRNRKNGAMAFHFFKQKKLSSEFFKFRWFQVTRNE